jgi:hypothetical protein
MLHFQEELKFPPLQTLDTQNSLHAFKQKLFSLPIYKNQGAYMGLIFNDFSNVPVFISVQL